MGRKMVFALTVICMLVLLPAINAYVYDGYRWSSGTAYWRFSIDFPDGYKQAVQNAASTWNNADALFSFNYRWWELNNKFDWENLGSNVHLASTTTYYTGNQNTNCGAGASITRVVTNMNNQKSWTTSPSGTYPPFDVQTVATHEFGHWLSLGHSSTSNAVMYYAYTGTKRLLHSDDINGIECIYGT